MSTILDALKKSEKERKLSDVPTLSDIPAPQEKSRWPVILLLTLLTISLVIIVWLLAINNPTQDDADSAASSGEIDNEIDSINQANSSDLTVNIISYSPDVSQRFAIIDGRMFREGEFVKTGIKVQSIEQDSITLNDRGELISRQP